ncbi:MAG: translation initiation factor [Simkaniaceae bacterium]|nr:translation initiation factor [Simkaniaceae bacterium]MCF7853026.1 translation initiation factor [Simkaniaceae bacterium]
MPFTFGGDFISREEIEKKKKKSHPVRITKERRKNSFVTLIHNLPLDPDEMKALLKDLKIKLGSGGAIKDDTIQLQGDHVEKLKELLKQY